MDHGIQSDHSGSASAIRSELVWPDQHAQRDRGDDILHVDTSYSRFPVRTARVRWWAVLLVLLGFVSLFVRIGSDLGLLPDKNSRLGIGDVERAQSKIAIGMSKDKVRSLLGHPYREEADEWDYWANAFVGCVLRIHFGPDDCVTSSECWAD
jgi:hypothetical protein